MLIPALGYGAVQEKGESQEDPIVRCGTQLGYIEYEITSTNNNGLSGFSLLLCNIFQVSFSIGL